MPSIIPSKYASKQFTTIAACLAMSFVNVNSATAQQEKNPCKTNFIKTFVPKPNLGKAFIRGMFFQFDQRPVLKTNIVKFDKDSPHYLKIYLDNPAKNYCSVIIDAVDTITGTATELIHTTWGGLGSDPLIRTKSSRSKTVGDVKYTFNFLVCNSKRYVMKITQDLSRHPQCKNKKQYRSQTDISSGQLTWKMTGFKKTIPIRTPEIIKVVRGASPTVGNEITTSREVGFSLDKGKAASAGINLFALQGALQKSVNRSQETKFEQAETSIHTLTLDWAVCDAWRIDRFRTVELGHVTAPRFGVTESLPFTVVLSQNVKAKPLCREGTNIARPEDVKKEKEVIRALTGPK